jgi:hypothetical protein
MVRGAGVLLADAGGLAAPGDPADVVPHPARPVSPAMITSPAPRMSLDMTLTLFSQPASIDSIS